MLAGIAICLVVLFSYGVTGHGLVTRIIGFNGVTMPGLTVIDGVPRDCPSSACGAHKDTAIIRDEEVRTSKASPLGRTSDTGPVDPSVIIEKFMEMPKKQRSHPRDFVQKRLTRITGRQILNDAASVFTTAGGQMLNGAQDIADMTPAGGAIKNGQSAVDHVLSALSGTTPGAITRKGTKENGVSLYRGTGQAHGLPTASSEGVITLIYHQVNQDGAGPLIADIDSYSGGTDPDAFKSAEVVRNIAGVEGFSTSSTMDYKVEIQVPSGTKCSGSVGTARNVCIVRVRNTAISGPFGGSAAFTQE
ncbi:hypothetical protein BJX96DRAFT_170084 [Aspergillus floccosus]